MTTEIRRTLWPLASGKWTANSNGEGFNLYRTANNQLPAKDFPISDLCLLLQLSLQNDNHTTDAQKVIFPPEFTFSPTNGKKLTTLSQLISQSIWVPPFGATSLLSHTNGTVRGLRQACMPIKLHRQNQRKTDDDPDDSLDTPPPGDYEYFSIPAGSREPALIALDPAKGLLFLFLPETKRWERLRNLNGGHLAESHCLRAKWRCEVAVDGLISRIFIPTQSGLACLIPDAVSLSFTVSYIEGGSAVGAPLQFNEMVWAPLKLVDGGISFVSANANGHATNKVDLPNASLGVKELGALHPPLTDGRKVIWPSDAGQLILRAQADGKFDASFQPWPVGVKPSFEFGCPYFSRDGDLWQLCFDSQQSKYIYFQLGTHNPEQHTVKETPRLSSGSFNFRFDTKNNKDPWLEPEHGDDGGSDTFILPLLESTSNDAVLGLKLETTAALADLLNSGERMRAEMVLDDKSSQTAFHSFSVDEPWRTRLFIYAGKLWAYHPNCSRLNGWTLEI